MPKQPRIILNAIVKNEAAILPRMVRSARRFAKIDAVYLCDTGSTDDTRTVAEDVECLVHPIDWCGFGPTRERALDLCRTFAEHAGFDLADTYALLLDADHELIAPICFDESCDPAYNLHQLDTVRVYANVRLIRLDQRVRCIGSTHEYWEIQPARALDTILTPAILDHCDGKNRGEKWERDLELLQKDIKENKNARTWFYLGQTYEYRAQPGDRELAVQCYQEHQTLGSFRAEQWVSTVRLGKLRLESKDASERNLGLADLNRACDLWPERREPYLDLAQYYLDKQLYEVAIGFARTAADLPGPKDGDLFVDLEAYTTAPDLLLVIACFYSGDLVEGRLACERLLRTRARSEAFYSHALSLLGWYVESLESLIGGNNTCIYKDISQTFPEDRWDIYSSSSPTFAGAEHTIVRMVSYEIQNGNQYISRRADKKIHTRNLLTWRQETSPPNGKWVDEIKLSPDIELVPAECEGLEDIRVGPFIKPGIALFTATCCQFPDTAGRPQVGIGTLDLTTATVLTFARISYPGIPSECEKNWVIVSYNEPNIRIVYSWDPFVVLKVWPTGEVVRASRSIAQGQMWTGLRFRGGTQPVSIETIAGYPQQYLTLIHEVAPRMNDHTRLYLHRFVQFDLTNGIAAYSDAFYFEKPGIEYATGLKIENENLVIGYSVNDSQSHTVSVPLGSVLRTLHSVDSQTRAT